MEKAENGCFDSQLKLADAFCDGKGVKRDLNLARKYDAMLFNNTDSQLLQLAVLWNSAIYERELGNYDNMKEIFQFVIDFMQENIPMEEWDFSLFQIMEEYTQE